MSGILATSIEKKKKHAAPPIPPPSVTMKEPPTPPPSVTMKELPTPPPSVMLPSQPKRRTTGMTKSEYIEASKEKRLKEFYDRYNTLPLAPPKGEGSKYKTPDDFKKFTSSPVKPPTMDTSMRLTEADRTAVEVNNAPSVAQKRANATANQQKNSAGNTSSGGEALTDGENKISKILLEKFAEILASVGTALTGIEFKEIYESGKETVEADGGGETVAKVVDTAFTVSSSFIGLFEKLGEFVASVNSVAENVIRLPIISSALNIIRSLYALGKSFHSIKKLSGHARFLKEKQRGFKKNRFERIMAAHGKIPEPEKRKKAAAITPNTNLEVIKKRHADERVAEKERRLRERKIRKEKRAEVEKERYAKANGVFGTLSTWWGLRKERKELYQKRSEERHVLERGRKQELKDAMMHRHFSKYSEDPELLRESSFIFFQKGDGKNADDYRFNQDRMRANVFSARGAAEQTAEAENLLKEEEEIIGNIRARDVIKTKLRGQTIEAISSGLSLVGEGVNLVSEVSGMAIPFGSSLSIVGDAMVKGNDMYNAVAEFFGNQKTTVQGERYLDRSSEVNTILRKADETRMLDESLSDNDKGPKADEFGQKYWETKKYVHAYGIDLKEATDPKERKTKYDVVKYLMEAVAAT